MKKFDIFVLILMVAALVLGALLIQNSITLLFTRISFKIAKIVLKLFFGVIVVALSIYGFHYLEKISK